MASVSNANKFGVTTLQRNQSVLLEGRPDELLYPTAKVCRKSSVRNKGPWQNDQNKMFDELLQLAYAFLGMGCGGGACARYFSTSYCPGLKIVCLFGGNDNNLFGRGMRLMWKVDMISSGWTCFEIQRLKIVPTAHRRI